jgi:hypothetical protein
MVSRSRNLALSIFILGVSALNVAAQEPAEIVPYKQPVSVAQSVFGKQWRAQQAIYQRQMQLNYFAWYDYSPARPSMNANPYFQVPPARQVYVIAPYGQSYYFPGTQFRGF